MGPSSAVACLFLLLAARAAAQEPGAVELGGPVRDASTCFEFRVTRLAKLEPLAGAWMGSAYPVPLPGRWRGPHRVVHHWGQAQGQV